MTRRLVASPWAHDPDRPRYALSPGPDRPRRAVALTPPADHPAVPLRLTVPLADQPAVPLAASPPPADHPGALPVAPVPPADRPAAPPGLTVPPADHPAAPPRAPVPPADRPAGSLRVPAPPADRPATSPARPVPPPDHPVASPGLSVPPADHPAVPPADHPVASPRLPVPPADHPAASPVPSVTRACLRSVRKPAPLRPPVPTKQAPLPLRPALPVDAVPASAPAGTALRLWGPGGPDLPSAKEMRALEQAHRGALARLPALLPLGVALAMGKSVSHLRRSQSHLGTLTALGITYASTPRAVADAIVGHARRQVATEVWERHTAVGEIERFCKALYWAAHPAHRDVRADAVLNAYKAGLARFAPRRVPKSLPHASAVDLEVHMINPAVHQEVRRALCLLMAGALSRPAVGLRVGDVRLVRRHHIVAAPGFAGAAPATVSTAPPAHPQSLLVRCAHLKTARTLADLLVPARLTAASGLAAWVADAVPDDLCCGLGSGPTAELQRLLSAQGLTGHDLKRVVLQAQPTRAAKRQAGLHAREETTARYTWMVQEEEANSDDDPDGSGGRKPAPRRALRQVQPQPSPSPSAPATTPRVSRALFRGRGVRARTPSASSASSLSDSCSDCSTVLCPLHSNSLRLATHATLGLTWGHRSRSSPAGGLSPPPAAVRSRTAPIPSPPAPLPHRSPPRPRLAPVPRPSDTPLPDRAPSRRRVSSPTSNKRARSPLHQ